MDGFEALRMLELKEKDEKQNVENFEKFISSVLSIDNAGVLNERIVNDFMTELSNMFMKGLLDLDDEKYIDRNIANGNLESFIKLLRYHPDEFVKVVKVLARNLDEQELENVYERLNKLRSLEKRNSSIPELTVISSEITDARKSFKNRIPFLNKQASQMESRKSNFLVRIRRGLDRLGHEYDKYWVDRVVNYTEASDADFVNLEEKIIFKENFIKFLNNNFHRIDELLNQLVVDRNLYIIKDKKRFDYRDLHQIYSFWTGTIGGISLLDTEGGELSISDSQGGLSEVDN